MSENKNDIFSNKRNITISKDCFESLRISEGKTIKLFIENQQIMPYPKMTEDFKEQIQESLTSKGFIGDELDEKLSEIKKNVGWTIFRSVD